MKKQDVQISIIVPIYKVEKYLVRCVESLIAQDFSSLEIILVEDGSPDRCGEICDNYAKKDTRITAYHKPNGGLSDARNYGLELYFQELEGWKWNGYRLSLGGTSHVALTSFLERHPEIRRVTLYMDHDLAGFVNARKIKTMLHEDKRFRHIRVSVNPPRMGKDYNEKLLEVREQLQTSQHQRRPKEAAVSI